MSKPEMEKLFEIWHEGYHYEVGPDRDGLGNIEIRYYEGKDHSVVNRMSFDKEGAKLLAKALMELSQEESQ